MFQFCPFVQRVLLVLLEKNIPFQYIEVNPYHKPESLLKFNPRGLVPTLQYHNKPLYESTVICEFLEDAYADTPRLLPSDPYEKARSRIVRSPSCIKVLSHDMTAPEHPFSFQEFTVLTR